MPKRLPSASMIVALLALVVAMSGTAAAASLITSKNIKDGTIQTKDLSKRAISSLRPAPVAGVPGPAGPKGDAGEPGKDGAQGSPGPVQLVYRTATSAKLAPGTVGGYAIGCPASAPNVIGGGFTNKAINDNLHVIGSYPIDGVDADSIPDDNWEVIVKNAGAAQETLTVWAVCTQATSKAAA
jgi:hypothetical protein